MKDRSNPFDADQTEPLGITPAIPSLEPGPHRQELRRALMREARARADRRAGLYGWFLRRPAYACGVLFLLLLGVAWAAYRHRTALFVGRSGVGAFLGTGGDQADRDAKRQAQAIREAIETFDLRLEQVLPTRTGGWAYIYRTMRPGGPAVLFSADHILASQALQNPVKQQEFELALAAGEGGAIGEVVTELGTRVYQHRVNFYDGTSETYGSDREPDPVVRQQHRLELEEAIAQGRGEIAKTIPTADGGATALVKVTLSDGTIKTYASPARPGAR